MGDIAPKDNSVKDISDTSIFLIQVNVDGDSLIRSEDHRPLSAAVAVFESIYDLDRYWYVLPRKPKATTHRAKLMSVVMALDISLRKYKSAVYEQDGSTLKLPYIEAPRLHLQLCSDSEYALKCLTHGPAGWKQNDWKYLDGQEIKNKDLIFWALDLQKQLRELGNTELIHVPRTIVDDLCNQAIEYHNTLREQKKRGEWIEWVRDFEE